MYIVTKIIGHTVHKRMNHLGILIFNQIIIIISNEQINVDLEFAINNKTTSQTYSAETQ